MALKNLGKIEEAIKCYNQALKINTRYVKAFSNKGVALRIIGKHE